MSVQVLVNVDDRSDVGEARRAAAELTRTLSFDATVAGNVALAVTEAVTNIVKHVGHGRLVLRSLESNGIGGVEVLALDRGAGIANLGTSLRDGHSTAGSMGTGLGALSRLGGELQIYSQDGHGTALRLEFWASSRPRRSERLEIGAICLPKAGEVVSGDAWAVEQDGGKPTLLVADGLGHGADAARAARAATEVLARHSKEPPGVMLELGHQALAATRGAAVAVARIDLGAGQGIYAGVGNISGRIETPTGRRQLVSHNGTLGHALRKVQEFPFDYPPNGVLIVHSDGLSSHWTLADYPGLMAQHAALIAGVLYRDHDRGRDDVTVVVIKRGTGG